MRFLRTCYDVINLCECKQTDAKSFIIVTLDSFSLDWQLYSFRIFLSMRFLFYGIEKYRSTDLENFSVKVEQA